MIVRFIILLCISLGAFSNSQSQSIILKAVNNDGFDEVWKYRPYNGQETWGVQGDNITKFLESGNIWFNNFPGNTGYYRLSWGVISQSYGQSTFKLYVDSAKELEGRWPLPDG